MGLYGDNEKENGNYHRDYNYYRDYIADSRGLIGLHRENEKKTETLGVPLKGINRVILGLYWGYMGIMKKKMETTIGIITTTGII